MQRKNGFTLIELLAVLGILAIIALIATPIIIGIVEETKKDVFYTNVLSLVNATKMDIGNKYYEDEFTYTLEDGVIDNIEFPVSNAEGMYGMIEYDEDSKAQYAVHNGKYCVKKLSYMKKEKIFNYEGVCDFSTSEDCFEFSNGTITDYYDYEKNNENNDICPRNVVIPGTIDGKTVVNIGTNAFKEKELTSVEFPSTINYIATSAFSNNKISGKLDLSHLTEMTNILPLSFQNNQIKSVKFPASVTAIGYNAFQHNKLTGDLDLTSLTKLTAIGGAAFGGSEDGSTNQLTSVKLPGSVTSIGDSTFVHNKLSGELDLSHLINLSRIENNAFSGSTDGSTNQLISVKLPSSVTYIGINAFLNNKINGELDLSHCISLTSIGSSAFYGNQITSIKLPNSIETFGPWTFAYNKLSGELDLSSLTNLTMMGAGAFVGSEDGSTNQITSIKLPSSVTSIGVRVFENNQLTSITIPSSVTSIEQSAFRNNKLSGELDLSHLTGLTTIGQSAFQGNSNTNQITSIKLPSSVTSIGAYAFSNNKLSGELALSHLTGLTTIGGYAFSGSSDGSTNQITSIKLPSSVTSIGQHAFDSNKLSGELDLSNTKISSIEQIAFYNNQITSVKLPNTITRVGGSTFGNNQLTSVTFYGRSDLTGITIASNAWGWASGYNAENNIYFVNE